MTVPRPLRTLAVAAAVAALCTIPAAWAARAFITVGTSDVNSVFYQAGGAVCDLVNAGRAENQIRCTVASTGGSLANLAALRHGERALGFAHADIAEAAYQGTGIFEKKKAFTGLRTVLALNPETVTVVARDDAGIDTVQDLQGKRVNIGGESSDQRASVRSLMDALGWTPDDFAKTPDIKPAEQPQALCDGRLDAAVFVTGHPSNIVAQALSCNTHLVPVRGPAIDRLVRSNKYYESTVIPGGTYTGQSGDVPTYGMSSLLLSSTNTSRDVIYEVTKAVFGHLKAFRKWHPAFARLTATGMARGTQAIDAPVHPGAAMYYKDKHLL